MDGRKCKMWENMKMANAINVLRSEEMGLKKIQGV
jgi:alpha-D-ribose 1-methylphosphonate 5-triphosphate synthase subunit PhnG